MAERAEFSRTGWFFRANLITPRRLWSIFSDRRGVCIYESLYARNNTSIRTWQKSARDDWTIGSIKIHPRRVLPISAKSKIAAATLNSSFHRAKLKSNVVQCTLIDPQSYFEKCSLRKFLRQDFVRFIMINLSARLETFNIPVWNK